MKFILSFLSVAMVSARVEEKTRLRVNFEQVQQQQRSLQACEACDEGSAPEFHFSPTEATWDAHVALARLRGCELASIKSAEEQAAAMAAMEPFRNFPYKFTDDFRGSFVYIGGRVNSDSSNPDTGAYTFDWVDGSGSFTASRGGNTVDPYTNFIPGDPNGSTGVFESEPYLALSLNENGSTGIGRGEWVDFSSRKSPALYKCCVPVDDADFSNCKVSAS